MPHPLQGSERRQILLDSVSVRAAQRMDR
jgi:hypothetical protein